MSGFDIRGICDGPFATNAFLIVDEATKKCAIVDPGYNADEVWGPILEEEGLELAAIVLTHGHIDHVCGVAALSRAFPDAPILIHEDDADQLRGSAGMAAKLFGLPPYEPAEPTGFFKDGEPFQLGETTFAVSHVPGHSPGHIMLYSDGKLVSGDVIFAQSIGRTDLPGGNYQELAHSIVEKILPLGDEVVIYPGHGPITTVGQEKLTNPFVMEMMSAAGVER